jgi:hypothetical protein
MPFVFIDAGRVLAARKSGTRRWRCPVTLLAGLTGPSEVFVGSTDFDLS